jgi:hypothetical protein
MSEKHPSGAKARTLSLLRCGTTEVVPFENFRTSGVETRHSSGVVCGLAEAMPLLQSPKLHPFQQAVKP